MIIVTDEKASVLLVAEEQSHLCVDKKLGKCAKKPFSKSTVLFPLYKRTTYRLTDGKITKKNVTERCEDGIKSVLCLKIAARLMMSLSPSDDFCC